MNSYTIGPAPLIIAQAMELGILCRPGELGWLGKALRPTVDGFEIVEAWTDNWLGYQSVTPGQIVLDWTLTTLEILKSEERESTDKPF